MSAEHPEPGDLFCNGPTDKDMYMAIKYEGELRLVWVTWANEFEGFSQTIPRGNTKQFVCNLKDVFLALKRQLEND